jgi:predicted DNA-binding transcriptional regulator AlpA
MVTRRVDLNDLVDAEDVARLLGLAHRNTVSNYQQRYPDMPRPVIAFANGRVLVWRRSEIEAWIKRRGPITVGRPRKNAAAPQTRRALQTATPPPLGGRRQRGGSSSRRTSRTTYADLTVGAAAEASGLVGLVEERAGAGRRAVALETASRRSLTRRPMVVAVADHQASVMRSAGASAATRSRSDASGGARTIALLQVERNIISDG